jgi:hypothetical protein
MSENDSRVSKVPAVGKGAQLVGYISFFVAGLSLIASFYQGYLNTKYLDIIQKNVSRGEYMRTCKDIIDSYFQIKLKVSLLAASPNENRETEAANAVSHFAALGTYLANLQDNGARERYSRLSQELTKVATEAKNTPTNAIEKSFGASDTLFVA